MRLSPFKYLTAAVLLICLPLTGVVLKGENLRQYLEFPPLTRYVQHPGFSMPTFVFLALVFLITIFFLYRFIKIGRGQIKPGLHSARARFPWWGWIGLLTTVTGWFLAWNRFSWFGALQYHTFLPLWIGYILVVNALCVKRTARSLLTDTPDRFALLFPASALFWWFFEYLNRFVQNWYYLNVEHFSVAEYIVFATLAFSTVLPAVLSTTRLILTFPVFQSGLTGFLPLQLPRPRIAASLLLVLSGIGLSLIGVFPHLLFPLLWLSPLLIIVSIQTLENRKTLFSSIARGDWGPVLASSIAALICGFFWELWNAGSLAKWEYSIPYVHCCLIFEMPLLGYLGYFPFGLECLVVGGFTFNAHIRRQQY